MSKSVSCVLLAAVFAFAACGGGGEESKPATPVSTAKPAMPAAPATPPPATPPAAKPADSGAVPSGNLRGSAANGKKLYTLYCTTCHGPAGKGDGPAAAALNPKPADHTDKALMGALTDAHLYKVIDKGGVAIGKSPLMAPWGGIVKDQGVRDLIAHVRTLSGG